MVEKGSSIAGEILKEYRRKKFYEDRKKKKDDKRLDEMVEDFVEEMKNAERV